MVWINWFWINGVVLETMKDKKKVKQGKKNRASGARFELKVRKDLEDKG